MTSSRVQLEVRATLRRPSISVVSEPRAVATGSYAQLSKKLHFASYCVIRSLPLAVLTRLVATLTFNYTLGSLKMAAFLVFLSAFRYTAFNGSGSSNLSAEVIDRLF